MDRRLLLTALACWPAARLLAADEVPRPRHKVSAAKLHEALSKRFPVRARLGGLVELEARAPALLLLPARNKLGATLVVEATGLQREPLAGAMDLVFALRYEPSDQTLRAHDPEVLDIRWPGLDPEAARSLRGMLRGMTRDVGEVVLHTLTQDELALPTTMGFEPREIQVVEDGLFIHFGPKPRR